MDEKKYLVEKNLELKEYFYCLYDEYQLENVQEMINQLIAWYSIKYEDQYLAKIIDNVSSKEEFDISKKLEEFSKKNQEIYTAMNFDSLINHYSTFELNLFYGKNCNSDEMKAFQKEILIAVGWGLIYHKHTSLEYGFCRAKIMMKEFNQQYHLELNPDIYKSVIFRKYTLEDEEIRKKIEQINSQKKTDEIGTKKRKLTRIRSFFQG